MLVVPANRTERLSSECKGSRSYGCLVMRTRHVSTASSKAASLKQRLISTLQCSAVHACSCVHMAIATAAAATVVVARRSQHSAQISAMKFNMLNYTVYLQRRSSLLYYNIINSNTAIHSISSSSSSTSSSGSSSSAVCSSKVHSTRGFSPVQQWYSFH
jgi:hypothetical protein